VEPPRTHDLPYESASRIWKPSESPPTDSIQQLTSIRTRHGADLLMPPDGLNRTRPRLRRDAVRKLPRNPPRRPRASDVPIIARDTPRVVPSSAGSARPPRTGLSGVDQSQRAAARRKTPLAATSAPGDITSPSLNVIRKRIQVKGLAAVDGRIHAARVIKRWQKDLANDLGGMGALTTAQKTLLELSTRTRLILEHLDAYLLTKRSLLAPHDPPSGGIHRRDVPNQQKHDEQEPRNYRFIP